MNKNKKAKQFLRGLLFAGLLLLSMPAMAANPVFQVSPSNLVVCQGATVSFDYLLTYTDPDAFENDNFTVSTPAHGTVFNPGTTYGSGTNITVSGFTYTADAGYIGADAFNVTIFDNNGGTATITINVTVNPIPTVVDTRDTSICAGFPGAFVSATPSAGAHIDWYDAPTGGTYLGTGNTFPSIPPSVDTKYYAEATTGDNDSLSTGFAGGNGNTGAVFNMMPTNTLDINTLNVNTYAGANTYQVYYRPGTYVGHTASLDGWIQVGTFSSVTTADGIREFQFTTPLTLAGGQTYGFYIAASVATIPGQGVIYSSSLLPIGGVVASDDNLTIYAGAGANYPLTGVTGSTRVLNFTAEYSVNGCTSVSRDSATYTILPLPVLTTPLTSQICSGDVFFYPQTVNDTIAAFNWGRSYVAGITPDSSKGTGDINEALTNATPFQVSVIYADTLIGTNGCITYNNISLTVNPKATLYPTPLVGTICSGDVFNYTATSQTPAADLSYSWSRAAIAGNFSSAATGATINETLINNTTAPVTVTYIDTLKAYGCSNTQQVQVIVNPIPVLTSTLTPAAVCDSALFTYTATTATTVLDSITWTRDAVAGIMNAADSGNTATVSEYLDNITDAPVVVTYNFTLYANGACPNTQAVTVTVNPTPMLHATLTPASVCDSTLFHFAPDTTAGATVTWTRATVPGIANLTGTGTNSVINEYLHNTTTNTIVVTYVYTSNYGGCTHNDNVVLTVNPKPGFTNTPTASIICDSTVFNFTPTLPTAGSTYTWSRAFVAGIGALPESGTTSISERLKNNTYINVDVVYVFTVTANGCSNVQDFTITVRPTPRLISDSTARVCSGAPFFYQPNSATPLTQGLTYTWSRPSVAGITPVTRSGSGAIYDTLTNATSVAIVTPYVYTLTLGTGSLTCTNTQTIKVTVDPAATPAVISVMPPASLCANTLYQNFGAATTPPAGSTYTWSASNATVLVTGNTNQYAIVNFDQPGTTAVVTLTTSLGNGCQGHASYSVNVGNGAGSTPYVIYTAGHFVCLDNNVASFQWGYDDAHTLDSNMIAGEINQSYFLETMDANKNYWVMTKNNDGCVRKAYYNLPTGVTEVSVANGMSVYPNPATSTVNVEISTAITGSIRLELVNMMGQRINTIQTNDHKTVINVANLPAGYYIIDSYIGDMKIAAAKFIKN